MVIPNAVKVESTPTQDNVKKKKIREKKKGKFFVIYIMYVCDEHYYIPRPLNIYLFGVLTFCLVSPDPKYKCVLAALHILNLSLLHFFFFFFFLVDGQNFHYREVNKNN